MYPEQNDETEDPRTRLEPNRPLVFTHRPSLDFKSRPSQFAPEAPRLVSYLPQPPASAGR